MPFESAICRYALLFLAVVLYSCPTVSAYEPELPIAVATDETTPSKNGSPNILLIVVDDMGFTDLGAFGGEIDTPSLDELAYSGVRLTDFHAAPTCSPTRSMLMTGNDNHLVGFGTMAEMLSKNSDTRPGYEGYLNNRSRTIAEIFSAAGYSTSMSGKWHLGTKPSAMPHARGFKRSYALLNGGGSHFGGPEGTGIYNSPALPENYRLDGEVTEYPIGTYTADHFTDQTLGYIKEAEKSKSPFFAYLAFTEPHWPLQAPEALIKKYRGRYDEGPKALRAKRLDRLYKLGLVNRSDPHPMLDAPDWEGLTPEERKRSARAMEIYAAMVESVDINVGRIVKHLKESGSFDNTIIVFMSDNGPEGSAVAALMTMNGVNTIGDKQVEIDNRLENMGQQHSFVAYGSDWAQAASAPFNRFKGYTTEGGTRVAAFLTGPNIPSGAINDSFIHVTDILPTLMEMSHVDANALTDKSYLPPSGKSFVPALKDENLETHADTPIGTELFLGRSIRLNNWKAVRLLPADDVLTLGSQDPQWQLYDLSVDPGETNDLSKQHPQKLDDLVGHWAEYARVNSIDVSEMSRRSGGDAPEDE